MKLTGISLFAFTAALATMVSSTAWAVEFRVLPAGNSFTGSIGTTKLASAGGNEITCSAGSNTGEITGMETIGKVGVKFTGCQLKTANGCTAKATSLGTITEGEIATQTLRGDLGSSTESSTGAALLLLPETTKKFATLEATTCFVVSTVEGSLAGEVATVGSAQRTGKLVFTTKTLAYKPQIEQLTVKSHQVTAELEAFGGAAALTATDALSFAGSLEVS